MVSSLVLSPCSSQGLSFCRNMSYAPAEKPAGISSAMDPIQESTQEQTDRAITRFFRNLIFLMIKDAVACSKARVPMETKRVKKERMSIYNNIRTSWFRGWCEGLGYDYWTVERTIRGVIAGTDVERVEQLITEYDQEAVFYARRSTGRPSGKAKEGKVEIGTEAS